MNISHYAKSIPPLVIALIMAGITAFQGTLNEQPVVVGLSIALAVLNAFLTYQLPNGDSGAAKAAKAWVNVLHVGLQSLLAIVATGIGLEQVTAEQWSFVALAVVGALATFVFPNEPAREFVPGETLRSDLR